MCSLSALVVSVAAVVGQADGSPSTREQFQQFAELLVGRWVGDITLVYDWPGQEKKKGEKLTTYETFKWIADKAGIEWENFGGNTTGKAMLTWDPPSKRIKAFHVGSGGGTWQSVTWKETDTKWAWKLTGGLADGREVVGSGYWVFSDGGKTLHIIGDVKVGSELLPRFDDVYRRVAK